MKYYAVKKGKNTGIFLSWEDCEVQVKGYKNRLKNILSRRKS